MRGSARLGGKQMNSENKAEREPKAKISQLDNNTSKIAAMDTGTMVEAFKYLNYCQLAKNSLVSKRFRIVIKTHRHKLALLCVHEIGMFSEMIVSPGIKIFDKELSPEAYNEWINRNKYLKQSPLEDQVASTQGTQIPKGYQLWACAYDKDRTHSEWDDSTIVFDAFVELNHDNWPVFQHFFRLLTDPFIDIFNMGLCYQNDVLNLLASAINSDRLQCDDLVFNLEDNSHKSIAWAKTHVRCNEFRIDGKVDLNQDKTFLDFFVNGGHCALSIKIGYRDCSKAVVDFVQKFMDLKITDESQLVETIESNFSGQVVELLKRDYV